MSNRQEYFIKYSHLVFAHGGEWFFGPEREMVYVLLYVHAWYKSATLIYLEGPQGFFQNPDNSVTGKKCQPISDR